jgi:hypothetical protein
MERHIKFTNWLFINENEPWTGIWKVESTTQGGGIWAMKQEGKTIKDKYP